MHPELTPGPTPDKLAGKYENVDELVRAHENLQSTLTQRNNELQEIRTRLDAVEQQRIHPRERVDYREELSNVGVPPAAVEAIAREAVQQLVGPALAAEDAKQRARTRHEVLAQSEDKVVEFLQQNPEKLQQFQNAWNAGLYDMAYDWAAEQFLKTQTKSEVPAGGVPPAALMPPGFGGNRMAAMAEASTNNEDALWEKFYRTRSAVDLIKNRLSPANREFIARGIYGG